MGDHDIYRTETRGGLLGSLLVHGALALLVLLFAAHHVAQTPRDTTTVDIVSVDPAPAVVINPGPVGGTKSLGMPAHIVDPAMGRSGKRGHVSGPEKPKTDDPYAELTKSVDHGPEVGTGGGDHGDGPGRGLYGNGYDGPPGNGVGGGAGGLGVPSLKRPPSPREDYSQSSEKFPEEYAGNTIIVMLKLDAAGHVSDAKLERGAGSNDIDAKVLARIRQFEFWPALDDTGKPTASTYRWLWVLQPQQK